VKPKYIRETLKEWLALQSDEFINACRPVIVELAEILFFASLATEEKTATRVGIAWAPNGANDLRSIRDDDPTGVMIPLLGRTPYQPELAWNVLKMEQRVLDVVGLVKAAPLAEFGRTVLVAGGIPENFFLDGVARMNRRANGGICLVFYAEAPGIVSIVYRRKEVFRFERGESVAPTPPIFEEEGPVLDAINRVGAFSQIQLEVPIEIQFPLEAPIENQFTRVIRMLINSMSKTQHGGLLLLLSERPTATDWEKVKLKVADTGILSEHIRRRRDALLAWLSQQIPEENDSRDREEQAASDELEQIIKDIGRLTAVDNALLIGPDFSVLGAQFEVSSDKEPEVVYEARDVAANNLSKYDMRRHGSRHRAAANFVNQHPGSLALLSSEDGPLKCFLRIGEHVIMWKIRLPTI
jgi:hypothetical protein